MSLFKRRSRSDDPVVDAAADPVEASTGSEAEEPEAEPLDPDLSHGARGSGGGPFDVSEVDDTGGRLDVGALLLPLVEGVELQLQLEEATGQVTGVFIIFADSAVQLQAFAAPRHEGIWREICDEIATGITEQGGTADVSTGPFGYELLARVPGPQPDGRVGFQPLRFTGVDGPRWLLRAVFHGRAAVDPEAARPLEALVTDVVVVRGSEPMGPRELLPLHLPEVEAGPPPGAEDADLTDEQLDDLADEPGDQPDARTSPRTMDDLNPFERGPEITERR